MKNSIKIMLSAVALSSVIGTTAYANLNDASNTSDIKINEKEITPKVVQENKKLVSAANGIEFNAFKENDETNEIESYLLLDPREITEDSIHNYRNSMPMFVKELRQQGIKNAPATITFNKPLDKEQFENVINNHKIDVESFTIRTVHNDGTEGTIVGVPNEKDLVPEDILNEFLEQSNAEFVGLYAIEGNISTDENLFNTLQNDENIYLADISEEIIKREVKNANKFKELSTRNSKHYLDVHIPDFYWFIENTQK